MGEFYVRKSPRYRAIKVKGTYNPQEVSFANKEKIAEFVRGIDRPDTAVSFLDYIEDKGILHLEYVTRTARGYAPSRCTNVYIGEYLVFNEATGEFSAWDEREFDDAFRKLGWGEEADHGPGVR